MIEQEGEPKSTRGLEKIVRNRRPLETAPGHSQKIEARLAVKTEEERRARLENDAIYGYKYMYCVDMIKVRVRWCTCRP